MPAIILRYGIILLAAALAALSGEEGRGGDRPFGGPAVAPLMPRVAQPPFRAPVVVPPGTLGRTYRQISRLVPEDEHPRTGMIDLFNVPAGAQVTIAGMEGYRGANGVWHFRTVRPLLPCLPTIRTACITPPFGLPPAGVNYRAFRLIPGRIVTLWW